MYTMMSPSFMLRFALGTICIATTSRSAHAFSAATTEAANMAKLILQQSLYSPSGKLTFTPEIVIPEPTDPTALLLQSTEVTKLSEKLRATAKANAAIIAGSVNALKTFCSEQENARGNFPGPVPAIAISDGSSCSTEVLADIAAAGACGILLPVLGGKELSSSEEVGADSVLADNFKAALEAGLQPIPEVCIVGSDADKWGEEEMVALVDAITKHCDDTEPVSIVVTMNVDEKAEADNDSKEDISEEDESEEESSMALPKVPKSLGKKVPILGSVRAVAGGGRMGKITRSLKDAGFTGAFLRRECVPGLTSTITDLEAVSGFWAAAVSDLKSVRSKSFGFRAKTDGINDANKLPMEWFKYQKSVMESGALGTPDASDPMDGLDANAGDYRGF